MKVRYMCEWCYRLFDYERIADHHMCCPYCNESTIVEIDEPIARDVAFMNRKGYRTEHCCSGHYDEKYGGPSEFYVSFHAPMSMTEWLLTHQPDSLVLEVYRNIEVVNSFEYFFRLGPLLKRFEDDLFDKKVIEIDGAPDEWYFHPKKGRKPYDNYDKWREEIYQFAFHKWVVFLPDISNGVPKWITQKEK